MKSLKALFTFLTVILFALSSHAQTPQNAGAPAPPAAPHAKASPEAKAAAHSKESGDNDLESRMAKLKEAESKLQSKESKIKDPQMKADAEALLSKMRQIEADYNSMQTTAGMSEQQKEAARKKIRADMDEARKMHDNMKAKYGDEMGGKSKKGNSPQQPPQEQEAAPK